MRARAVVTFSRELKALMRTWPSPHLPKPAPGVVFRELGIPFGNHVRFTLSPQVAIAIGARAKRPGEGMYGEPVELSVMESQANGRNR